MNPTLFRAISRASAFTPVFRLSRSPRATQKRPEKDGLPLEISKCSFRGRLKKADSLGINCGTPSPAIAGSGASTPFTASAALPKTTRRRQRKASSGDKQVQHSQETLVSLNMSRSIFFGKVRICSDNSIRLLYSH